MFYSQICVNFMILWKNGDDWAKEEYTKLKGKLKRTCTH